MQRLAGQDANQWFVCPRANLAAEMRLFLFPYAGGGPAVFRNWELPDRFEAWIAHYPGRGSRHQEAPLKQITALVESLVQAIPSLLDKPFAFFGHSLGGLVAFKVAKQLRRVHLPEPRVLFVSACGAPHLLDLHPPIHALPDVDFLESLKQFNGIPSQLLDQPDAIQFLLPMLRADFEVLESYSYAYGVAPLEIPIVAFGGSSDPRVSAEGLDAWRLHTNSGFKSYFFPGDHFFIHSAREPVLACLAAELSALYEKR